MPTTGGAGHGDLGFSDLHEDIVKFQILSRLDGAALSSTASCSTVLRRLSTDDELWFNICSSNWPSISSSPLLSHFVSSFGPRAFFSNAYPILGGPRNNNSPVRSPPSMLISAVDVFLDGKLILTRTHETHTDTDWFGCSPFRIDLLEPKEFIPMTTRSTEPGNDEDFIDIIIKGMSLSWVLIDPVNRKVVNLSSHMPLTAERHWLTGEIRVSYSSILAGNGHLMCGINFTCAASEEGEMQVKEVSLQIQDMDGKYLNGKDSLVFLQWALEGKKGTGINRVKEARRRMDEYIERRRRREERAKRVERSLDTFCLTVISISICYFILKSILG